MCFIAAKAEAKSITGTAQEIDLGTSKAFLHNAGTGKVFITGGGATATTATGFPIGSGETLEFALTGKISAISDDTATLNILHVEASLD